jgi:hypothetical protein
LPLLSRIPLPLAAGLRQRLFAPTPPAILAGPVLRLDYGSGKNGGAEAVSPGGEATLYGEARLPVFSDCLFQYLLVSVPEGWVVPGRGLLSREGVATGIFGPDGEDRVREIFPPQEAENRYLLLRFIPSGPPGLDGFLHFTYVNGAVIAYDPGTGAATFTIILQSSRLETRETVPVAARGLSLRRSGKGQKAGLLSTERSEIAVAVAAGSPAVQKEAYLGVDYRESGESLSRETLPSGAQESAFTPEGAREKDGIRMDFPALGRGDRVIGLTFQAPDRERGGVFYDGAPLCADSEGRIVLGGDFFQPAKISFRAAGAWKGIVRLGFIAVVRHEPSGAEREVPGSVIFPSVSRKKTPQPPAAPAAWAQLHFPAPDPSLFRELAEEGTEESAADAWSAFTPLSLSDCLAQEAEDIGADLLPRRAYLQEYRAFSGMLADKVVPGEVFRTEYSAPAGFRLGGLEFDPASLLDPEEDSIPLPVVAAYAVPLGSFLPGGGVFGGFGAGFPYTGEGETDLPPAEADGLLWLGGNGPALRGDFLVEDGELDFYEH